MQLAIKTANFEMKIQSLAVICDWSLLFNISRLHVHVMSRRTRCCYYANLLSVSHSSLDIGDAMHDRHDVMVVNDSRR